MKVFRVVTSLDFYVWRYQITENAVIHHACFAGGILKNSALAGAARANSSAAAKALWVQRLLNRLRCCTTFKWAQRHQLPASLSHFLVYFETPREGERKMTELLRTDVAQ